MTAPALLTTKLKDFNEFKPLALRTEKQIDEVRTNKMLLLTGIIINIISAELLDAVKKQVFYGDASKIQRDWSEEIQALQDAVDFLKEGGLNDPLSEKIDIDTRVFHGLLGIITEAGELSEVVFDKVANNKPIDATNVQEEAIGDIGWYQAILADSLNLDTYLGLTNVINKLIVRYPDKFTEEAAKNRNLAAERQQLEVDNHDSQEN